MRKIFLISGFLLTACATTQPQTTKPPCTALPANKKILITNTSQENIIINRYQARNPGVSAGWSSSISPGHKSLLATPKGSFCASCTALNPTRTINCRQVLRFKTTGNSRDGYWVWENKAN